MGHNKKKKREGTAFLVSPAQKIGPGKTERASRETAADWIGAGSSSNAVTDRILPYSSHLLLLDTRILGGDGHGTWTLKRQPPPPPRL